MLEGKTVTGMADFNMTREEAIWYLTPIAESASLERYKEALSMAVAALREHERLRWIPVMERLPEQGERVLATDGEFVGEFYVNSRGKWKRYNDNDYSLMMALDILWWMPLPEPPKEDK